MPLVNFSGTPNRRADTGAVLTALRRLIRPTKRDKIVKWAKWGVQNEPLIHYAEVRPMPLTASLPLTTDCSGFITLCYKLAGCPDPNGLGYNGQGYTGTLLDHGRHIPKDAVQPGDVVVYGPGTGWHTALIVQGGPDPLTVSHGQEKGPEWCRVSQDGRLPQTFLRFPVDALEAAYHKPNSATKKPVAVPPKPIVHVIPTVANTTSSGSNVTVTFKPVPPAVVKKPKPEPLKPKTAPKKKPPVSAVPPDARPKPKPAPKKAPAKKTPAPKKKPQTGTSDKAA